MDVKHEIKVNSGNHDRKNCPASITIKKDYDSLEGRSFSSEGLKDSKGKDVPMQMNERTDAYEIMFMIESMDAHKEEIYSIIFSEDLPGASSADGSTGVKLEDGKNGIDISVKGKYFTTYVYSADFAKPFLGPVVSSYNTAFTRLDFETAEHIHQRSVWFAIGDVEGHDFWNEPPGLFGKQVHQSFDTITSGPVAGKIVSRNDWITNKGTKLMTDTRSITVYNTPSSGRLLDLELTIQTAGRRIELGATKDAGPLGVCVNESMKVDNGGTIINAYGSISEKECWGKKAEWCDYYGPVEGKTLGISVFDHNTNDNFPTYWHVRNYGLLAPNNFYFAGGGILKPDEKMTFKYRLYFHTGTNVDASVAEHYQNYINPPVVSI